MTQYHSLYTDPLYRRFAGDEVAVTPQAPSAGQENGATRENLRLDRRGDARVSWQRIQEAMIKSPRNFSTVHAVHFG